VLPRCQTEPMSAEKPAVVLLHGLTSSSNSWREVIPLLPAFDVHAPTSMGHVGGTPVERHPVAVGDLVDEVERYLDDHGLQKPHIVGHSFGGYLAIELARRGRASTVCAITPGGFWGTDDPRRTATFERIRQGRAKAARAPKLVALLMKPAFVRRRVLTDAAGDGARVSAARAVESLYESLGCTVFEDIAFSPEFIIAPLDPLPCPVTIAWAEKDPIIAPAVYEPEARKRLPAATFETLSGLAHEPMMDAPERVAAAIHDAISAKRT